MLSGTVRAILYVLKLRRMGKMRKMLMKILSLASRVKMTKLAGWWPQSPKWNSTTWRVFGTNRWGLLNWCNWDGGTWPTNSGRERYEVLNCQTDGWSSCQPPNRHNWSRTISDNLWRPYAHSWYRPRTIVEAAKNFSTRKQSDEAGFGANTVTRKRCITLA